MLRSRDFIWLPQLCQRSVQTWLACHHDSSEGANMLRAYRVGLIAAAVWTLTVPAATFAQQTNGGIAGTARDTSGAVLPGVTVEASSSVLIERVRTATTDGDGRFNI